MPKKRFNAEQIVTLLRQIEVTIAQGKSAAVACRDAGISLQSYYRWRKEYGGLEIDQAKRMKGLERENVRLKRLVQLFACYGRMPAVAAAAAFRIMAGYGTRAAARPAMPALRA
jgi:putative transposase